MADTVHVTPKFKKPPVVETVLGVFFKSLPEFTFAKRVRYWANYQNEFPDTEEKVPIDEVQESFGVPYQQAPQIRMSDLPSPRLWAKSSDKKNTLQVQQNGVFVNWEKNSSASNDSYEHYANRRNAFKNKLDQLTQFFTREKIGKLEPTTCFVTYINHIQLSGIENFSTTLGQVLSVWHNDSSDGWLPPVELASLNFSYVIPDQLGRLRVNISPAQRKDITNDTFMIRFDITARLNISPSTTEAALQSLDIGHEWVVRSFASLTKKEMHTKENWERVQ